MGCKAAAEPAGRCSLSATEGAFSPHRQGGSPLSVCQRKSLQSPRGEQCCCKFPSEPLNQTRNHRPQGPPACAASIAEQPAACRCSGGGTALPAAPPPLPPARHPISTSSASSPALNACLACLQGVGVQEVLRALADAARGGADKGGSSSNKPQLMGALLRLFYFEELPPEAVHLLLPLFQVGAGRWELGLPQHSGGRCRTIVTWNACCARHH